MKNAIIAVLMSLIVGVPVSATFAGDSGKITPANMNRAHRLYNQGKRLIWIASHHKPARIVVNNPMAAPETNEQRLYEVNIHGFTTIYMDPKADYRRQGAYPIGDDHHLMAAQQLIRKMNAKPARVVRNPNRGRMMPHAVIHPQMILLKPEMLHRPNQKQPRLEKIEIPSVPAPPKKKNRLMAMSN